MITVRRERLWTEEKNKGRRVNNTDKSGLESSRMVSGIFVVIDLVKVLELQWYDEILRKKIKR